MGKKSRKKGIKNKWVKAYPDIMYTSGPLSIIRYGRHIEFINNSTPEEHADFLAKAAAANIQIFKELEQEIAILQKLVTNYDPIEVLHCAAYEVIPQFLEYRSESELDDSISLPALEYLQYIIARSSYKPNTKFKKLDQKLWKELWEVCINVINLTSSYNMTLPRYGGNEEIEGLGFIIAERNLRVRVKTYINFIEDYWKSYFVPYEVAIKEKYKISVEDLIENLNKIKMYQRKGVIDKYSALIEAQNKLYQKLSEHGYTIDKNIPVNEKELILAKPEFIDLREELRSCMKQALTPDIFDISGISDLPKELLDTLSIEPGESVLSDLKVKNDDLSPLSTSTLHSKPFVKYENRYYYFYHSGFEDSIGSIIEESLFKEASPQQISSLSNKRNSYLENETKNLLSSLINPDFIHQNLYYPNPEKASGLTELDIMIGVDDILFLVEVKSGSLSKGALRGSLSDLKSSLADLLLEAQHQSLRAEQYIKSSDSVIFFDKSGKIVRCKINNKDFRKIIRIAVSKDNLGWVGAKLASLDSIDPTLKESLPWHISITDLRVVKELFPNDELKFLHYLEQRLKAAYKKALDQNDELEHVALYHEMNAYFEPPVKDSEHYTFAPEHMQKIDFYFADKLIGENPKIPSQTISTTLNELLLAFKNSKMRGRFEAASAILSLDATERKKLSEALDTLRQRMQDGKSPSLRRAFSFNSFGLSFTYADEKNIRGELIDSITQMRLSGCSKWKVIQLKAKDDFEVESILTLDNETPFTSAELEFGTRKQEARIKRVISAEKTGRNDPCPCGSRLKYKRCHG